LLGTLLPIAWALDARVEVAHMDQDLFEAMDAIKAGMVSLYPNFKLGGDVIPKSLDLCRNDKADGSTLLLFSGGVDSLAGYLDPKGRPDHLLTMAGGDIKLDADEAWADALAVLEGFASKHGHNAYHARSNAADPNFTQGAFLNHRFRHVAERWNWGIRIQHGMAILSESAPVAWVSGASQVRISATYSVDNDFPVGSHPKIDTNVAFAGMTCEHSGFELTRSAKEALIAKELPGTGIRVCRSGAGGGNCGRCEKCARTLVGLLAAGADPNAFEIPTDAASLATIRDGIEYGRYRLAPGIVIFWHELKVVAQVRADWVGAPTWSHDFLNWLADFDMDLAIRRSGRRYWLGDQVGFLVNRYLPAGLSRAMEKLYVALVIGGKKRSD